MHLTPEQSVIYVVRTGQSQVGAEVLQMWPEATRPWLVTHCCTELKATAGLEKRETNDLWTCISLLS